MRVNEIFWFILIILFSMVALIYPVIAFISLIVLGFIFSEKMRINFIRVFYYWILVGLSLYIVLSRSFTFELQADLLVYYYQYEILLNSSNILNIDSYFSKGFEYGWPTTYYLIGILIGRMEPLQIFLVNSLIFYFGVFIWIELYGKKLFDKNNYGVLYSCFFLFLSVISIGFLQRQTLSFIFLLFFISNIRNYKAYFFSVLSILFHLSAIYFLIIIILAFKFRLKFFSFLVLVVCCLMRFVIELRPDLLGTEVGANKISYFADQGFSITSFRYLILVFPMILFCAFVKDSFKESIWFKITIFSLISYIVFLGVPNFPERMSYIFVVFSGFMFALVGFQENRDKRSMYFFIYFYIFVFMFERFNFSGNLDGYWIRYSFNMLDNFL